MPTTAPKPIHPLAALAVLVGFLALGFVAAALGAVTLDPWSVRTLYLGPDGLAAAERTDWYKLLRVAGYLPSYAIVALCFILADWSKRPLGRCTGPTLRWQRGPYVLATIALAGLFAEVIKLTTRRARPDLTNPDELFRWVSFEAAKWSTSDLALPSSHAAVAFAGAWAVGKLYPRTLIPLLALAIGCAWTRLAAGQHHLSDVVLSAFLGLATAAALTALFAKPSGVATAP